MRTFPFYLALLAVAPHLADAQSDSASLHFPPRQEYKHHGRVHEKYDPLTDSTVVSVVVSLPEHVALASLVGPQGPTEVAFRATYAGHTAAGGNPPVSLVVLGLQVTGRTEVSQADQQVVPFLIDDSVRVAATGHFWPSGTVAPGGAGDWDDALNEMLHACSVRVTVPLSAVIRMAGAQHVRARALDRDFHFDDGDLRALADFASRFGPPTAVAAAP